VEKQDKLFTVSFYASRTRSHSASWRSHPRRRLAAASFYAARRNKAIRRSGDRQNCAASQARQCPRPHGGRP
jgi:hypothetical protein